MCLVCLLPWYSISGTTGRPEAQRPRPQCHRQGGPTTTSAAAAAPFRRPTARPYSGPSGVLGATKGAFRLQRNHHRIAATVLMQCCCFDFSAGIMPHPLFSSNAASLLAPPFPLRGKGQKCAGAARKSRRRFLYSASSGPLTKTAGKEGSTQGGSISFFPLSFVVCPLQISSPAEILTPRFHRRKIDHNLRALRSSTNRARQRNARERENEGRERERGKDRKRASLFLPILPFCFSLLLLPPSSPFSPGAAPAPTVRHAADAEPVREGGGGRETDRGVWREHCDGRSGASAE